MLQVSFHLQDDDYQVGDEIGEYTLTKQLGSGAFSKVFEASTFTEPCFKALKDLNQQYRVALKIVPKKDGKDKKMNELLYMKEIDNETAVWSRLFHPFILQMCDMY